jgi:hypothetical protein
MLAPVFLAALLLAFPVPHERERAVLVYPRERWSLRPVFYTPHQRQLVRELSSRYAVELHEQVATDDALFSIDVTGAKLLVLSGHGDPFSMYFASRKARTLDASDRARLEAFFSRLDPNATIVLQSCHTGRGFAHLVKDAAGPTRHVIAARGEVPPDGVSITALPATAPDVRMTCRDRAHNWDCTVRLP